MARIAVVGAGLSGLVAAFALTRRYHEVILLEAAETLGGQIQTDDGDGYLTELGAEGFVARSQVLPELAAELGLSEQLVGQSLTRSLGYRDGSLRELAPGEAASFLGFQVSREDMGAGIRSFARGMGSLIHALEQALAEDVEIHRACEVTSLERTARSYRLRQASDVTHEVERVVMATSERAAARLLGGLFGPPALQLAQARTLSSVTVSLAWSREHVTHALDATGFVVASEDQAHGIRACTFTTSKFAGRAPADKVALRVFFRPSDADLKLLTDAELSERASTFVSRVLGITSPAERSWVSRWAHVLPVFDEDRQARVAALEQALAGSGVVLAGSAFHGAGIDAAVRSALRAGNS